MTMFQKLLLAGIAGLILVVGIVGAIVVGQLAAAERQADYERCLAIRGFEPGQVSDLDAFLEAAEICQTT